MGNRYVNVTITRQTQPVSQAGFGTGLLLAHTAHAYKEYLDAPAVAADFAEETTVYKKAAAYFGQENKPEKLAIYGIDYAVGTDQPTELTAALNTLVKEHNDWFYLLSEASTKAEIEELDKWIATQDKMLGVTTTDQNIVVTSENTFVFISDVADNYLAEAVIGYAAPLEIGSYIVQFKTLSGVTPCKFDETEISAIEEKNFNTYLTEGGVNLVHGCKVASGDYIDNIQAAHYIKARMAENVFAILKNTPKVPFTNAGIGLVVSGVEDTLKDAFNNGIIAEEEGAPLFNITYPLRAQVPANDRANRTLPDVKWTATVAGAIQKVNIAGLLQV